MLVSFNEHVDEMAQRAALLFAGTQVSYCLSCPPRTLWLFRGALDDIFTKTYSGPACTRKVLSMAAIPEKPLEELIHELPPDLRQ